MGQLCGLGTEELLAHSREVRRKEIFVSGCTCVNNGVGIPALVSQDQS